MAGQRAIRSTRAQITKGVNGDPAFAKQIEDLRVANGGAIVARDVVVDVTGTTLVEPVELGTYLVDAILMIVVVGGGGANGFTITDASTATLDAGSYAVPTIAAATAAASLVARPGPYISGPSTRLVQIRGFIDVQKQGLVGFVVAQTGVPTSVTLLAGSGLALTRIA